MSIKGFTIDGNDHLYDYPSLGNLPSINNVQLVGNKTPEQLGLASSDFIDDVDNLRSAFDSAFTIKSGKNLLNPENIRVGGYYKKGTDAETGRGKINFIENSAFSCAFVDVVSGEDYIATGISYNAYTGDDEGFAIGIARSSASNTPAPVFNSSARNSDYNNPDKTITRIYFSWRHEKYPTDTFMVNQGDALLPFEPYAETVKSLAPDVIVSEGQIAEESYVVDINGTGDFSSFTSCIRALRDNKNKKTIYVKAGVYDIFAEIGGQSYAESISGQGLTWFDVSDVIPPNTKIIGLGEVVFQFKPTAEQIPTDVASLLSPVNVIYDIYIENITIDCDNCRYGIHDDTGHLAGVIETRHIYKNIKIIKLRTAKGMDAAFGCGMQHGQYMEFDNCNFYSESRPFSFHNKGTSGNVDGTIIVIKNSVAFAFSSTGKSLRFGNVNGKQVKITVDVLNSYMNKPNSIVNESSTERPNAYAITYVGCGNPTTEIDVATNIYEPVIYAIT